MQSQIRPQQYQGATTARLVFCEIPIAVKLFMIPQTVPKDQRMVQ